MALFTQAAEVCRAGLTARAWIETVPDARLRADDPVARASQLARGLKLELLPGHDEEGASRGPHSSRVD